VTIKCFGLKMAQMWHRDDKPNIRKQQSDANIDFMIHT